MRPRAETHRSAEELTGPVGEGERRTVLDALRGLAIVGVLVANVFTFAYPMVSSSPQIAALRGAGAADRVVQVAVGILVEGKFYAMLSMLFGMGLMLQSRRVAERGGRFARLYARRLLILFAIGIAHGILLYSADILSFYALIALAATAFRGLSGRRLLGAAIAIFLIGLLVAGFGVDSAWPPDWERLASGEGTLPAPVGWALRQLATDSADFCRFMADEQRIFQEGTWSEITKHRAYAYLLLFLPAKLTFLGLFVLGLFLFGMYLVDSRVLDRLDSLRRFVWPAILVGVLLEITGVVSRTVAIAGSVLLAAGYAAALARFCRRHPDALAVRALAALGRLALTNYLLQSVVYGLLFYATGFGLHARLTALELLLITLPLFLLQVTFSLLWLRRFQFGPLEWLWRSLTYGTRIPLLRAAPEAM